LQYTEKSCKMKNIFVLVTILGHLPVILSAKRKVQLINVNSKMRKNLFYFLTKKGRTFPLVKISFFERY